jgi:hypothetical protein
MVSHAIGQFGGLVKRDHASMAWMSQGFDSLILHQSGGVAQLVRAIACHAIGRGFESLHSRQKNCARSSVG